jgi:hypothetical protein
MNLSSLGPFSSLATSALDTARSTFKGLAEAAVTAGDTATGGSATSAGPAAAAPAQPAGRAAAVQGEATTGGTAESAAAKGRRTGTVIDAYA